MCMLFIHLSVDGHLGDFHLLAIVTDAAVNIDVQISDGDVPTSEVAGPCDNSPFSSFSRRPAAAGG